MGRGNETDTPNHITLYESNTMEWMTFFILVGVALIDGKLCKIMRAQRDHNRKIEDFLKVIRDHEEELRFKEQLSKLRGKSGSQPED